VGTRKKSNPVENRDLKGTERHGADAQLSSLTGGIAHDLNTVLTTIYGYCELALESLSDSRENENYIRRIIAATDRAKTLTGQLLDLSRRATQEKVPVRVANVLADTIDFISPSLPKGIRINRRIRTPDASVMAAPVQLFRVFMNLTINAIQAMRAKGGTLTVTVDHAEPSDSPGETQKGSHVLIRFTDTGTGMDEETAAKIFRPFFTGGKEKGTGLGLTVVSDAVREMGGRISVISAPDAGTTFDLIIPDPFFGTIPEKN
jgi:signal transduction histidine kinase